MIDAKTKKKVNKTFEHEDGCLKGLGTFKAPAYSSLVNNEVASMNIKQKALKKLGVEEEEVKEIQPLHLFGYNDVNSDRRYLVLGDDWLTSNFHDTWLFFSQDRVLYYNIDVSMKDNKVNEKTEEFSYKDITSVATADATWEWKVNKKRSLTHTVNTFALKVFGEKFEVTIWDSAGVEAQIKTIKNKVREKKE